MTPRKSDFKDIYATGMTTENRTPLANVIEDAQVPNKAVLSNGSGNYKTTFRDTNTIIDSDIYDSPSSPITFKYGGDKGINTEQFGSC